MEKKLVLTDSSWSYGSYHRKKYKNAMVYSAQQYKNDVAYSFLQYKDFLWRRVRGAYFVTDTLIEAVRKQDMISAKKAEKYHGLLYDFFADIEKFDEWPLEKVYGSVQNLRRRVVGAGVLEDFRKRSMEQAKEPVWNETLLQKEKKEEVFLRSDSILFALCEPQWFSYMRQDIICAMKQGKRVYLLCGFPGGSLPAKETLEETLKVADGKEHPLEFLEVDSADLSFHAGGVAWNEEVQKDIAEGKAGLFFYGEEGFMHCRHLLLPSIIHAVPKSYIAKAQTNQWDGERSCMVYVPSHWEIEPFVSLAVKTKLSYWQLARLWEAYGDQVYEKTVEELYAEWPQYFLNIYENGMDCPEAAEGYPIQIKQQEKQPSCCDRYTSFLEERETAISEYLNQTGFGTYFSAYFDEELHREASLWREREVPGVMVHGIKTAQVQNSHVLDCKGQGSLRQMLKTQNAKGLQLYSNFLFFLTPKLTKYYNEARKDRPREQIDWGQGHLDYMLDWQDGERTETFPLYQKACIAMKRDGRFLFFHYCLGGGKLNIRDGNGNGVSLAWEASDVNQAKEQAADQLSPVLVYTPYFSQKDAVASIDDDASPCFDDYALPVGEGRLNIVIIQEKITCIRKGDVLLPSIGVVVSLSEKMAEEFLEKTEAKACGDGYYDCSFMQYQLELEHPAEISEKDWKEVVWCYGGGLTLFQKGENLFPMEETDEAPEESLIFKEGWLSPMSRQGQESSIHSRVMRHPRTAIGVTEQGELFVLVFSGRTKFSKGADYREVCYIAKQLIPDIADMMNVDGGGSAVFGMAIDGNFMELSYPSTSMTSVAGMVRQINTVLCLEQ